MKPEAPHTAHKVSFGIRSPLLIGLALGLVTVATRLPFASQRLFSFDAANYAFALRDYYNVAHHQPHPPGYPLYVALAKLLDLVVQDPNRSLVLLSIAAAAVAVSCTYWLGRAMFGNAVGLAAAVILLTSVGFWGYSEVAHPYTFLAAASAGMALLAWRVSQGAPRLAAASGAVMGLVAGVRWDAMVFLFPLWLLALRRAPVRSWVVAGLGLAAAVALWTVPMVQLSGGWEHYGAALRAQSDYVVRTFSPVAGGGDLRFNFQMVLTYLRETLGIVLLVLVLGIGRMFGPWRLASDQRARFLLVWLLPPLAVYLVVHIGLPGYVLSVAPVAAILAAWTLVDLASELRPLGQLVSARRPGLGIKPGMLRAAPAVVGVAGVAIIAAWSANAFLTSPGPARLSQIRTIDASIRGEVDYVRTLESVGTVVLAYDRYRQAQYYLADYDVRLLFDQHQPDYRDVRSRLELSGIERVVVLDEDVTFDAPDGLVQRIVVHGDPEVAVWLLEVEGAQAVEHGYWEVALVP